MKKRIERDYIGYLFILPNLLIYGAFIFIPLIFTVYYSVTDFNLFNANFIGIQNFQTLLNDRHFKSALINTMIYTVCTVLISLGLGLGLALALRSLIWGRKAFRLIVFLPYAVSIAAACMAWLYLYNNSHGVINYLLGLVGHPGRSWLREIHTVLPSLIVMGIWSAAGYVMVIFTAGLNSIPDYLYEAAVIDGANPIRRFLSITFPMLTPTTLFLFIMQMISSFQVFVQIHVMTNGGPMNRSTTVVHQIYLNAFEGFRMGYASAQAIALLVIVGFLSIFIFRFGDRSTDIEVG